MFEGLYSYEKVMMMLGVVMFATMVIVLMVYVIQKRGLTTLLPFFLLPVIMIGFPAFQKISFENGKLEIEKNLKQVQDNPNDVKAQEKLNASLSKISERPISDKDTKTNLTMARAYAALGEPKRALKQVDSVLTANPNSSEAMQLQKELTRTPIQPVQPKTNSVLKVNPNLTRSQQLNEGLGRTTIQPVDQK